MRLFLVILIYKYYGNEEIKKIREKNKEENYSFFSSA